MILLRCTPIALLLNTIACPASAQLEQLPADQAKRIASAASEALKSGKLANRAVLLKLELDRAHGYRFGPAALVIVPDAGLLAPPGAAAAATNPRAVAMVIARGCTLGDFKEMIPPDRAAKLPVPNGPQDLAVF